MKFFNSFTIIVSSLWIGEYALYIPLSILGLQTLYLFTAIFIKKMRKFSKGAIGGLTVSAFCLLLFKLSCEIIHGNDLNLKNIPFAFFVFFIVFCEFVLICVLFTNKDDLDSDKRLINSLLQNYDSKAINYFKPDESENPFKRIDFLPTVKGFDEQLQGDDFSINFSYLKKCVNDLSGKPLTLDEQDFLQDLDVNINSLAMKNLSNYERFSFSAKLSRLVKIMAKYDKANFDVFSV